MRQGSLSCCFGSRMRCIKPSIVLAVVASLACAGSPFAQAQPERAATPPPQIATSGVGELKLPPARATVLLVVETAATDAATAAQDNARRVARVRRALEKEGMPGAAVQNAGYSVRDEARRPEAKEPRFVARNAISVALGDVARVGAIIDAALEAGATHVEDIRFYVADEAEAKRKALAAAVQEARAQAEAIAQAAGGRLGAVIEISALDGEVRPLAMARAAPQTDVSRGDIVVTQRVMARWRFVPRSP